MGHDRAVAKRTRSSEEAARGTGLRNTSALHFSSDNIAVPAKSELTHNEIGIMMNVSIHHRLIHRGGVVGVGAWVSVRRYRGAKPAGERGSGRWPSRNIGHEMQETSLRTLSDAKNGTNWPELAWS